MVCFAVRRRWAGPSPDSRSLRTLQSQTAAHAALLSSGSEFLVFPIATPNLSQNVFAQQVTHKHTHTHMEMFENNTVTVHSSHTGRERPAVERMHSIAFTSQDLLPGTCFLPRRSHPTFPYCPKSTEARSRQKLKRAAPPFGPPIICLAL